MLTVSCILWVANASLACAKSNKVWLLSAVTTAALTISIYAQATV